ncbi:dihydrofolate reductase-like domain-containing protein, partial [Terfezia claveryi]
PFVTLTYATSLDSHLALAPGAQTALSGPLSKSLTHYLRSRHDGILIGTGTAIADDPSLNCRTEGGPESDPLPGQPRPIILDPNRRWHFTRESRIFQTVREGKGKAPIILTRASSRQGSGEAERWRILCEHGGLFMCPKEEMKDKSKRMKSGSRWSWKYILEFLYKEAGIKSLMIEGGGNVINDLLGRKENLELIDSVVLTIAPVYLGKGGVNVCPDGKQVDAMKVPAVNFKHVNWNILGRDVVM